MEPLASELIRELQRKYRRSHRMNLLFLFIILCLLALWAASAA